MVCLDIGSDRIPNSVRQDDADNGQQNHIDNGDLLSHVTQ